MPPMTDDEIKAMQTERDTLKAELEKLKAAPKPDPAKPDPAKPEEKDDLAAKAKAEREAAEAEKNKSKNVEEALKFNLQAKEFIKNNASLLPENIAGIFEAAEKEKYDSAVDKAAAIKVGIVQEYFAKQENLDQLTASQKRALENFLALTKNVKQERVSEIYDSIFEPTLEATRKVKKAEALQKGLAAPSDTEDAYKTRLIKLSRQHHLREKQNA